MNPWIALSGSILLGACAQIMLKHGVNTSSKGSLVGLMASPWVMLWAISFGVATVLWIVALSRMQISYAYPLLGFGYVVVTVLASVFLGEHVSRRHWLAVITIAVGAALVARSS